MSRFFDDEDEAEAFFADAVEDEGGVLPEDYVASLVFAVSSEMARLFAAVPGVQLRRCEFQLFGWLHRFEVSVPIGSAIWNGVMFQNVTPFARAALLLELKPPRKYRYTLYGVMREVIPRGICYTYVFPNGLLESANVNSPEGRTQLVVDIECAVLPQLMEQLREED